MEESASKRRRVSPPEDDPDAPPRQKNPPRQSDTARSPARKRPSFASPTVASLARHNPQVLQRRMSASPTRSPTRSAPGRRPAPVVEVDEDDEEDELSSGGLQSLRVAASEVAREEEAEQGEEDATRRTEANPTSGSPVRRAGGSMAAAPRRSLPKPSPRPIPSRDPEEDEDFNPFQGRTLRRSAANTGLFGPPQQQLEPELPPPVNDPVSSTPPKGIHSTPTKWRDKHKPTKSSPLKPDTPRSRLYRRTGSPSRAISIRDAKASDKASQAAALLHRTLDPTTSTARKVTAHDRDLEKRREIAVLKAQQARLQHDLDVAQRENERIRLMQNSGRVVPPPNGDEVLGLMWQYLVPLGEAPAVRSRELVKAVYNPMALLPFSKPVTEKAMPAGKEEVRDVVSHYPVEMNAKEELPFLQLFSAFDATTDIAVLPQQPGQPVRQRHLISLTCRDAPGLFSAKLNMVVNAADLTVLDLKVPSLDPASRPELKPFIDKLCSDDCNRSMHRQVGIMTWAMGEWARVATDRARLWIQLDKALSHKDSLDETIRKARSKRNRPGTSNSDDENPTTYRRADMNHYIGQQAFEFDVPIASAPSDVSVSSVRLEWKIDFDWTGEAQNKVCAKIGIPGRWHEVDERGAFAKLPRLFKDLVSRGEDPASATKVIVALVAGQAE